MSTPTAGEPDRGDAVSVSPAEGVDTAAVGGPVLDGTGVDAVDVYWRPGCGYCTRLLRVFDAADVTMRLHNIWEDDEARQFVRDHNRGNETVPTVAVGGEVVTNPPPKPFVAELRAQHPALVGAEPVAGGLLDRLRGR